MVKRKVSRVYVVHYEGKNHLIRAFTYNGAVKFFVGDLLAKISANSRVATQDDIIELMGQGTKVIDATQADSTQDPGADGGASNETGAHQNSLSGRPEGAAGSNDPDGADVHERRTA